MIKNHLISSFFLIILFLMFTPQAFAQNREHGFDIKVGLDFSAVIYQLNVESDFKIGDARVTNNDSASSGDNMIGLGGTLSLGYRWKYVGAYLEYTAGGLWWLGNNANYYGDPSLLMAWFMAAHGFFPLNGQFELEGGIGFGGALSDGDRPSDDDGNLSPAYGKPALITDNHGNPTPCPALHFSAGFTYYLTRHIGIGYFFDYNLIINTYRFTYSHYAISATADVTRLLHQINTGIQVRFRFY